MASRADRFRLSPTGLLRAAAWPLAVLDGFGDAALGADARAGAATAAGFRRAHDEVLERERRHLWAATLDDPAFVRALLLASPAVAARLRSRAGGGARQRDKAVRIVEHTLFRQLTRAAGRPTPLGLWAGVGSVGFAAADAIEPVAARCCIAPDLRCFQRLLRALAKRPAYRRRDAFALNPTLHAAAGGGWAFLARGADDRLQPRVLAAEPLLARLLDLLDGLPPLPLPRIAVAAIDRAGFAAATADALLGTLLQLVDGGVLVGGLDLPRAFATPWQALDLAAEALCGDDRRPWRDAVEVLRDRCARLADAAGSAAPDAFARELAAAAQPLSGLARALDLAPPGDGEVLFRGDLQLPWRLQLGPATATALRTTLADYDRDWLRRLAPAHGWRAASRDERAEVWSAGGTLASALPRLLAIPGFSGASWPRPAAAGRAELRDRLAAWEACLASPGDELTVAPGEPLAEPRVAALGCLMAGFADGGQIAPIAVADMPMTAIARFASLVDLAPMQRWSAAELARLAAAGGFALAQLRQPFAANPNALAAPALAADYVDPWGADAAARSLLGARLGLLGSRPVLWLRGERQPRVVVFPGTANVQADDPLAWLLLQSGLQETPGPLAQSFDLPVGAEIDSGRFAPRVRLSGGALLRRRRTVLGGEHLRRARGSERFLLWQQLARQHGWPALLRVGVGGGERLLIRRDSPLAIEALFKGAGAATAALMVVEEAGPEPGLTIPGHGRHVVELALPFAADS